MLTFQVENDVAWLRVDDGKANVVSEAYAAAVNEGLDRALQDARAVVLMGRTGRFSAGYDLDVVRGGGAPAKAMREAGSRLMARLLVHPQPVLIACTGHAVAAGALILLTGDTRIGLGGDFKIGLNETAIGLALPPPMIALARARMPNEVLTQNVLLARLYSPQSAVDAGYLDEVVSSTLYEATVRSRAAALVDLGGDAYAAVKQSLRGPTAKIILEGIG